MNITPKQLDILRRVRDHRARVGYAPTMQEIADELGVSKVTVFEHVEALIEKGLVERQANKARSLVVSGDAPLPGESSSRLPLVGRIAAGEPIEAVENREYLDMEEMFTDNGKREAELFVLRVSGDSMIDEHIRDGDYVVCRSTSRAKSGDTVVALLDDGEATLKKFRRERSKGMIRLEPANDEYEPIRVEEPAVQIQGVVVGVVRQY